jgi:hypothetical protein
MSGLRPVATVARTAQIGGFVPFANVAPELLGEAIGFELAFRHDYRPQIYRA